MVHLIGVIPKKNLIQGNDNSEPYIRISNEGYFNSSVPVGDRMITEIERVTESIVSNKYWGNP